MTLFDVALKNVRRNLKSYGVYIGSMIFSIMIYFTFVTLKYSDDLTAFSSMKKQVQGIMSASSVILIIFVAIFIMYSNSFFLKKRKKEVALYSLLGVQKKQIGFLLFFENLLIGVISLIIGIVGGFFISKLLLMILIKLMGYDVVASFSLSWEAVGNTALIFFLLFLFTSFQGYRVIYQFKLIELFQAEKKGEAEPKAKSIAVLLGVALIAFGYYVSAANIFTSKIWATIGYLTTPLLVIISVVVGTYLLFHSVLVWVLRLAKSKEGWAWKGLNMMTASQLLYRIRGNAKTLTIIAILSATTITAGGSVFSLYYNTEKDTAAALPNTVMWQGEQVELPTDQIVYEAQVQAKEYSFTLDYDMTYSLVALRDYNNLAKLQNKQPLALGNGEMIVVDPYFDEVFSSDYTNESIEIEGKQVNIKAIHKETVFNSYTMFAVAIIQDELYDALALEEIRYQAVELKDEKNQLAAVEAIQKLLPEEANFSSFTKSYKDSIQSLGVLLFVGTFLGLVFLAATGSIIYFKMMTEAEEDRAKYEVLHKVGVSKREMKRTIRQQVGFIFAVPLVIGLLHGAFALKAFSSLFMMDILQPVLYWMIAYSIIYGIYYVLTARYFYKTVTTHISKG